MAGALYSEAVAAPSKTICHNFVAERHGLPEEAQRALPYRQLQAAAAISSLLKQQSLSLLQQPFPLLWGLDQMPACR